MWYMWEGRVNPPLPFCLYGPAHLTPHRFNFQPVAPNDDWRSYGLQGHPGGIGTLG